MTSVVKLLFKAKKNQIAMMADRNYKISTSTPENNIEYENNYNDLSIDEFIDLYDGDDKQYMSFLNMYYINQEDEIYILYLPTPNDRKMNADIIRKINSELESLQVEHVIIISEIPPNKRALESASEIDNIIWEFFTYEDLVKNPTKCVYNSEHRILNAEEKNRLITQISNSGGSVRDMPAMSQTDMTGRWYGVRPGDIVEIIQASPADIAVERNLFYRRVR